MVWFHTIDAHGGDWGFGDDVFFFNLTTLLSEGPVRTVEIVGPSKAWKAPRLPYLYLIGNLHL